MPELTKCDICGEMTLTYNYRTINFCSQCDTERRETESEADPALKLNAAIAELRKEVATLRKLLGSVFGNSFFDGSGLSETLKETEPEDKQ